jgi:hypothetical protein
LVTNHPTPRPSDEYSSGDETVRSTSVRSKKQRGSGGCVGKQVKKHARWTSFPSGNTLQLAVSGNVFGFHSVCVCFPSTRKLWRRRYAQFGPGYCSIVFAREKPHAGISRT